MNAAAPPWDDTAAVPANVAAGPGRGAETGPSHRDAALAEPVEPAESTIDEMLEFMARQVQQVVNWTRADGFDEAYRTAKTNTRALFQAAVFNLGNRANQLLKIR